MVLRSPGKDTPVKVEPFDSWETDWFIVTKHTLLPCKFPILFCLFKCFPHTALLLPCCSVFLKRTIKKNAHISSSDITTSAPIFSPLWGMAFFCFLLCDCEAPAPLTSVPTKTRCASVDVHTCVCVCACVWGIATVIVVRVNRTCPMWERLPLSPPPPPPPVLWAGWAEQWGRGEAGRGSGSFKRRTSFKQAAECSREIVAISPRGDKYSRRGSRSGGVSSLASAVAYGGEPVWPSDRQKLTRLATGFVFFFPCVFLFLFLLWGSDWKARWNVSESVTGASPPVESKPAAAVTAVASTLPCLQQWNSTSAHCRTSPLATTRTKCGNGERNFFHP